MNPAIFAAAVAMNNAKEDAAGPGFAGPPPQGPLWRDLVIALGISLVIVAMLWSYIAYVK